MCEISNEETEWTLIIGASSFIGKHLYQFCKKNGKNIVGTYYTHKYNEEWIRFNLCTDNLNEFCQKHFKEKKLKNVIVCSADTSIDRCKKNQQESSMINILGTQRILSQTAELGAKCVFLSSEAVFDGKKGMYVEEDKPNPITNYGLQKLYIEQYIMKNISNYLIFRISRAVSSEFGEKDIFDEFYHKMFNCEKIVCLKNQSFCITEVMDIVKGIVKSLEMDMNGLFHVSSENFVTRFELARLYATKILGGYDGIVEKDFDEMSFVDNRHIYGGLNGDKLANILKIRYMNIEEILNKYVNSYIRSQI